MTPRAAVEQVLNHCEVRPVPYHIKLTEPAQAALNSYYAGSKEVPKAWGYLAVFKPGEKLVEEVAPKHWRDRFGVVWDRSIDPDIGVVKAPLLTRPSRAGYVFPDPDDPRLYRGGAEWSSANAHLYRIHEISFSLFERAWTLRGFCELLVDMLEEPAFVEDLLDAITEHNLCIMQNALAFDFEMFYFGDDYGSQKGLLMSPQLWRRFLKPRLARLFGFGRMHGKKIGLHSCGRVQELLPDLIEIGLDLFNPFQPEVMEVRSLKREYGTRLCFYGGISVQQLLPHGTPGEVAGEVRALLQDLGKGGGYVASPSHRIPRGVPPENIEAMIQVLCNQA